MAYQYRLLLKALCNMEYIAMTVTLMYVCMSYQEYIVGRERESILLHILQGKRIMDN